VPGLGYERVVNKASELLADPRAALAGALLEGLAITEPRDIELSSDVPYGSGLGGSSALTVAMAAALSASVGRDFGGPGEVELVRDVETRVLGKPAGVQDYYPPLSGGLHNLRFFPGRIEAERRDLDLSEWLRHLTLYDTGVSHSSGMNNWEIFRSRLEGDLGVAARLDDVGAAAREMSGAAEVEDFRAMGAALKREWEARRRPDRRRRGPGARRRGMGRQGVRRRGRGVRRRSLGSQQDAGRARSPDEAAGGAPAPRGRGKPRPGPQRVGRR
jgi:D-glycero-alpha-D-manno-heptose-7-phosphate kinase